MVGAGPGNPDLLTCRAKDLLSRAEVIAYDALISPSILCAVNPEAELISVGHRGYGSTRLEYAIHPMVIEKALQGKMVVRLKSGDPLIYGRAAQECEELREKGISFEIVPGITAAIGAASYAGLPLTHKDFASDLMITSGHDLRGGHPSKTDWQAIGKSSGTIVIYMAASKVRENCQRLMETGRPPETPVAFVAEATRGSQKTIIGTLQDLHFKVGEFNKAVPALIVVGQIVSQSKQFAWREERPLHSLTLMLVRSRPNPSLLGKKLRESGADVLEAPWVTSKVMKDSTMLDHSLRQFSIYSNIIFSCVQSVRFFFQHFLQNGSDLRKLNNKKILAIGEEVKHKLQEHGLLADVVLDGQCEQAVTEKKAILAQGRNLILISNRGRPDLEQLMKKLGIAADLVPAYDIEHQFPFIEAPRVDYIILPSSTSARWFLQGPWGSSLRDIPMLALGPKAQKTAKELGALEVHIPERDDPSLVIPLLIELMRKKNE